MYFQGNNIGVYDKTGKLVQRTDYYASGEPWLEPEYSNSASGNRYLFSGKERMAGGALNEYDFEARNYVASFQRFTTIDPLTEATPSMSPYAYGNANPINFIDPFGLYNDFFEAMRDAMFKYHGANVYYDTVQHEYYIALDKYGVNPYRSGGYLTKHFGEDSPVAPTGYLSDQSLEFLFGSYLSIQKEINYSEFFGTWKGQNGKIYNGLKGKGPNRYTGSRTKARYKSSVYDATSKFVTSIGLLSSAIEYKNNVNNPNIGPNMKHYLTNKFIKEEMLNGAGIFNIYAAAASFGYNLGYVIEDAGQWILNNPDFRIRINPYTLDFTPIEQTLQLYDELGIEIY